MKGKKKLWLIIVGLMLAAVFIVSLYQVLSTFLEYEKSKKNYEQLKDENVVVLTPPAEEEEPAPRAPVTIDFENLLKENDDVVGWLYCEGTPINYPVMQSEDNDYYLHRSMSREYDIAGSLFMDYRNDAGLANRNTIIYGHNMKNNTMFGTFDRYKKQSYYEEHPVIWYLTPEGDYKIELFAGFVAPADSRIYSDFATYEKMVDQSLRAMENSTFKSEVDPAKAERIITLSTCSYEYEDARYILLGILKKH